MTLIFVCGEGCVVHLLRECKLFKVVHVSLFIFGVCIVLLLQCFICLLLYDFLGLLVVNGAVFEFVVLVVDAIDE